MARRATDPVRVNLGKLCRRQRPCGGIMANFAVLGSGGWGTAIAVLLAGKPGHSVTLWSARPETAIELQTRRENVRQLRGVAIPPSVVITADPKVLADAETWIVAIPTAYLRETLARVRPFVSPDLAVVSLT